MLNVNRRKKRKTNERGVIESRWIERRERATCERRESQREGMEKSCKKIS